MKLPLLSFLVSVTLGLSAQDYELKPDEVKGQIITSKGDVLDGYIKLKGDAQSPWNNQKSVEFFTESALADGKVKGKELEKFKPKDIKGYVAGDRYFESVKISAAKLSIGVGVAQWNFVEKMVDGDIKMYRLYESPDPVSVTTSEEERVALEQEYERMRNEPLIVLQKGEDEMITLTKVQLTEYLSECPEVQDKYKTGGYGVEPFNPDAGTSVGKWISRQMDAGVVESILPEILTDYNDCVQ